MIEIDPGGSDDPFSLSWEKKKCSSRFCAYSKTGFPLLYNRQRSAIDERLGAEYISHLLFKFTVENCYYEFAKLSSSTSKMKVV